ncbi:MAG: hypothetical protein WC527_06125 [Candidatus Margulisiibacteriota bacterium]
MSNKPFPFIKPQPIYEYCPNMEDVQKKYSTYRGERWLADQSSFMMEIMKYMPNIDKEGYRKGMGTFLPNTTQEEAAWKINGSKPAELGVLPDYNPYTGNPQKKAYQDYLDRLRYYDHQYIGATYKNYAGAALNPLPPWPTTQGVNTRAFLVTGGETPQGSSRHTYEYSAGYETDPYAGYSFARGHSMGYQGDITRIEGYGSGSAVSDYKKKGTTKTICDFFNNFWDFGGTYKDYLDDFKAKQHRKEVEGADREKGSFFITPEALWGDSGVAVDKNAYMKNTVDRATTPIPIYSAPQNFGDLNGDGVDEVNNPVKWDAAMFADGKNISKMSREQFLNYYPTDFVNSYYGRNPMLLKNDTLPSLTGYDKKVDENGNPSIFGKSLFKWAIDFFSDYHTAINPDTGKPYGSAYEILDGVSNEENPYELVPRAGFYDLMMDPDAPWNNDNSTGKGWWTDKNDEKNQMQAALYIAVLSVESMRRTLHAMTQWFGPSTALQGFVGPDPLNPWAKTIKAPIPGHAGTYRYYVENSDATMIDYFKWYGQSNKARQIAKQPDANPYWRSAEAPQFRAEFLNLFKTGSHEFYQRAKGFAGTPTYVWSLADRAAVSNLDKWMTAQFAKITETDISDTPIANVRPSTASQAEAKVEFDQFINDGTINRSSIPDADFFAAIGYKPPANSIFEGPNGTIKKWTQVGSSWWLIDYWDKIKDLFENPYDTGGNPFYDPTPWQTVRWVLKKELTTAQINAIPDDQLDSIHPGTAREVKDMLIAANAMSLIFKPGTTSAETNALAVTQATKDILNAALATSPDPDPTRSSTLSSGNIWNVDSNKFANAATLTRTDAAKGGGIIWNAWKGKWDLVGDGKPLDSQVEGRAYADIENSISGLADDIKNRIRTQTESLYGTYKNLLNFNYDYSVTSSGQVGTAGVSVSDLGNKIVDETSSAAAANYSLSATHSLNMATQKTQIGDTHIVDTERRITFNSWTTPPTPTAHQYSWTSGHPPRGRYKDVYTWENGEPASGEKGRVMVTKTQYYEDGVTPTGNVSGPSFYKELETLPDTKWEDYTTWTAYVTDKYFENGSLKSSTTNAIAKSYEDGLPPDTTGHLSDGVAKLDINYTDADGQTSHEFSSMSGCDSVPTFTPENTTRSRTDYYDISWTGTTFNDTTYNRSVSESYQLKASIQWENQTSEWTKGHNIEVLRTIAGDGSAAGMGTITFNPNVSTIVTYKDDTDFIAKYGAFLDGAPGLYDDMSLTSYRLEEGPYQAKSITVDEFVDRNRWAHQLYRNRIELLKILDLDCSDQTAAGNVEELRRLHMNGPLGELFMEYRTQADGMPPDSADATAMYIYAANENWNYPNPIGNWGIWTGNMRRPAAEGGSSQLYIDYSNAGRLAQLAGWSLGQARTQTTIFAVDSNGQTKPFIGSVYDNMWSFHEDKDMMTTSSYLNSMMSYAQVNLKAKQRKNKKDNEEYKEYKYEEALEKMRDEKAAAKSKSDNNKSLQAIAKQSGESKKRLKNEQAKANKNKTTYQNTAQQLAEMIRKKNQSASSKKK